jgi:hypothetical protein
VFAEIWAFSSSLVPRLRTAFLRDRRASSLFKLACLRLVGGGSGPARLVEALYLGLFLLPVASS